MHTSLPATSPSLMVKASHKTAVSKRMAYILRHRPPPEMGPGGYVPLPVLLRELGAGATEELVRQIVAADSKGRYELDGTCQPPCIRAVQGHSIDVGGLALAPVTSTAAVPAAVHVTSEESWQRIQECGELRRMGRNHIHFATAPNHMRANSWATVLLQLDVAAALQAGHELFFAANDVLLTAGPLATQFVRRVRREELPAE